MPITRLEENSVLCQSLYCQYGAHFQTGVGVHCDMIVKLWGGMWGDKKESLRKKFKLFQKVAKWLDVSCWFSPCTVELHTFKGFVSVCILTNSSNINISWQVKILILFFDKSKSAFYWWYSQRLTGMVTERGGIIRSKGQHVRFGVYEVHTTRWAQGQFVSVFFHFFSYKLFVFRVVCCLHGKWVYGGAALKGLLL